MLNVNQLLKKAIQQVKAAGIQPGSRIDPEVIINDKTNTWLGLCSSTKYKPIPYNFQISLRSILLNANEKAVMEVLVHEVLHTCKDCMNHGPLWKSYASKMNKKYGYNIKRTVTLKELGIENDEATISNAKYVIKCKKCDNKFLRNRKSKITENCSWYTCNCGGDLELIKSPTMNKNSMQKSAQKSAAAKTATATKKAKYIIECTNCNLHITRTRKSKLTENPERYICKCGGKLKVKANK